MSPRMTHPTRGKLQYLGGRGQKRETGCPLPGWACTAVQMDRGANGPRSRALLEPPTGLTSSVRGRSTPYPPQNPLLVLLTIVSVVNLDPSRVEPTTVQEGQWPPE